MATLKMNDVELNDIDELRKNFDLENACEYCKDGSLLNWLQECWYEEEAEKVEGLDKNDADLGKKLCEIFNLKYSDFADDVDPELLKANRERLKKYTSNSDLLGMAVVAAFNQGDLGRLLSAGKSDILLVNGKYRIPLKVTNKRYFGVGEVVAEIRSKEIVDFNKLGIVFNNIRFDEAYQSILDKEKYVDVEYETDNYDREAENCNVRCNNENDDNDEVEIDVVGIKYFDDSVDYKLEQYFRNASYLPCRGHLNIVVIGHEGHGISTLCAAISKTLHDRDLAEFRNYTDMDGGILREVNDVNYYRASFMCRGYIEYTLINYPSIRDCIMGMTFPEYKLHGAILVVSAKEGPMPFTRELISLLRQIGINRIVVFINKIDQVEDLEMIELVEQEVRDLLNSYGFPGDYIPVIMGSARFAIEDDDGYHLKGNYGYQKQILELVRKMDEYNSWSYISRG